jgi:hypothetical protein
MGLTVSEAIKSPVVTRLYTGVASPFFTPNFRVYIAGACLTTCKTGTAHSVTSPIYGRLRLPAAQLAGNH